MARLASSCSTKSTKYGASDSSARAEASSGSFAAFSASAGWTTPVSAITLSTTLRRWAQRSGERNGDSACGDWIMPASVAASASDRFSTSLPK